MPTSFDVRCSCKQKDTRSAFLDGSSRPAGVIDGGELDDLAHRRKNRVVRTFRRYVAIGDSSTEGLEDPDGNGGYRGWADRLAQHIADNQDEPLEYANLAIRGFRMKEIRTRQFDEALAMEPDLLSVFGGINDVIVPRCDFDSIRADYVIIFGQARRQGAMVLSFTVPDLSAINPLGMTFRDRVTKLNDIIRTEADRHGVVVMDFEQYPVAQDPRLWFADRLHGNELGHQTVAAALAWRLGIDGFDDSWTRPLEGEPVRPRGRQLLTGDIEWAMHHLAPWLGKGIRRVRTGYGIERKRPIPTVVPKSMVSEVGSREP
jgi:lysophospholipase L1-like esterase